MRPRWLKLNEHDQAIYRVTAAFLAGRLEEKESIEWALKPTANDSVMRLALLDVIDTPAGQRIDEPWRSAWRLIEESWKEGVVIETTTDVYHVQHRLAEGDRSGAIVTQIVDLVTPSLEIRSFSNALLNIRRTPRKPKKVEDLLAAGLTSGEVIDPHMLKVDELSDRSFLVSLAQRLDAAVSKGLDIAGRIGWKPENMFWQLGGLYRVYYVPVPERGADENEPDEFHRGIAPSVKLLYAVVSRLLVMDDPAAMEFAFRWKLSNSPIHMRLWAALATDARVAPANEIAAWLMTLDDSVFWDLHEYPEISELRARRYGDMGRTEQAAISTRVRRSPPRRQWPRKADLERVNIERVYWAARELRRIEVASASLSSEDKTWLDALIISKFPDLAKMVRIVEGFPGSMKARWGGSGPDRQYDLLVGADRLRALEEALLSGRRGWDDDPADSAAEWIRQPGNTLQVLADLEIVADGGGAFSAVWERFGWTHAPIVAEGGDTANRDLLAESSRVLAILSRLAVSTIRSAIAGISHWLSTWAKQLEALPDGLTVWLKVWPIAVEVTNSKELNEDQVRLDTVARPDGEDGEPMDLDTLNTPAGKLVGVFLTACPNLGVDSHPFDTDGPPRTMRDVVIVAPGRSGLIARHRMIESLSYFLCAAGDWTMVHLVAPLRGDSQEALPLWRAIVRRPFSKAVIEILGDEMVKRANDRRLRRDTRQSLVFSLVVESLYAFHENRDPVVSRASIQQMLRSLEDEVRAYGAEAVQRFVRDVSAQRIAGKEPISAEQLLRSAAAPFLQQVWPQEHSLATPGVSRALAELPAISGEAFAEAVGVIERFLVPFDCWSMIDYGLYGEEDGQPRLSWINDPVKAEAFLRLLDRTVGTAEGSVIPHDLANALDQIRSVAPNLSGRQEYRRLATAARRA